MLSLDPPRKHVIMSCYNECFVFCRMIYQTSATKSLPFAHRCQVQTPCSSVGRPSPCLFLPLFLSGSSASDACCFRCMGSFPLKQSGMTQTKHPVRQGTSSATARKGCGGCMGTLPSSKMHFHHFGPKSQPCSANGSIAVGPAPCHRPFPK